MRNHPWKMETLVRALCLAGLLWLPTKAVQAGDWKIESVDAQGASVKYTSLKVDTFGNVHVAYMIDDQNHYPLRYALWDHSLKRWFTMTVDENVATCSLALDSKQRPHISYTDYAGGRLKYAHWDGAKWRTEVIPVNSQNVNYYQSISLTPDDHPNISFYEYQGPKDTDIRIRLRTVIWNGQNWDLRTVDSDPGSGKFNTIAADPQGHLHLAYANVSAYTGGMRYAFWDGRTWNLEILEGEKENHGHGVGWSCNIALDKQSNPHLTYVDEVDKLIKYAVRKAGKWQIQVIDKVAGIAYPDRNSIAFDDQQRPYMGYYDAGRGILKLARLDGQKWTFETVDGGYSGFTSSMDIKEGDIWISYGSEASGLKVARSRGFASSDAGSGRVSGRPVSREPITVGVSRQVDVISARPPTAAIGPSRRLPESNEAPRREARSTAATGPAFKVLSVSCSYPNPGEPTLGIFVERRLQHLSNLVELKVVAPFAIFKYGNPSGERVRIGDQRCPAGRQESYI